MRASSDLAVCCTALLILLHCDTRYTSMKLVLLQLYGVGPLTKIDLSPDVSTRDERNP